MQALEKIQRLLLKTGWLPYRLHLRLAASGSREEERTIRKIMGETDEEIDQLFRGYDQCR